MSKVDSSTEAQLAAAREAMDRYRVALQALASDPSAVKGDVGVKLELEMRVARARMKKYYAAYRALAE